MYVKERNVKGHKVWYCTCYYYDGRTGERRRVRKSTGIRSDGTAAARKRAELVGAEIERRLASGLDREKGKTLEDAFVARAKVLNVRGAPESTRNRAAYSAVHVFGLLGPDTQCAEITTERLVNYAESRFKAGASPDTVRRELADLSAAFDSVAVPCPKLPELPPPRVVERFLTPDEAERLLEVMPLNRARVALLVMQTGLRKQEVFSLQRIAPGIGRLMYTERTRKKGGLKTGERTIPLTAVADAILSAGPLEPWTNQGRDLKAYAARAGLGRVTWNDLRATPATHLLLAGVPNAKIAALLGHSSTRMVDRRYARIKGLGVTQEDLQALLTLGAPRVCHVSSPSKPAEPAPAVQKPHETDPKTFN